jgi:hypothetical protein
MKIDGNSVILFKHLRLGAVQQQKVYKYFFHRSLEQLSYGETLSLLHFLADNFIMKPLQTTRFRPLNSSFSVEQFYENFKMIDEKRG